MKTQDNEQQASHKAGPWKMRHAMEESGYFSGVYRIENESSQMQVATVHNYDTDATNEANARLIAAAPETAKERDELKAANFQKQVELNGANIHISELKALNADLVDALKKMCIFHEKQATWDKGDNGYYSARELINKINS